jgi:hypothetical protein
MIPVPPPDPVLGPLDAVLSESAMAEAIARYLPDCAGGAVGVESCRPTAIRYKPGRSCLVRYKVILRDLEIGTTIKTRAHAELHAGIARKSCGGASGWLAW